MHHSFAGGKNAFGVRVSRGVGQVTDHVLLDFLRRVKPEHRQIADIEFDDLVAVFFHLPRSFHDRTPDVITNIRKLGRFGDGFGGCWHV